MVSIQDLEQRVGVALKARDEVTSRTLRMLLSRLKNERIAAGSDLSEAAVLAVVQSEYKRRKEAEAEFTKGNRTELADAERAEAEVLLEFLPAQASEADIASVAQELIGNHGWTAKDFGLAMKALKEKFGAAAEGAVLSRVLKEYLH
ncbi:MAG: GatB/YqeY domain-containing protein [Candidatus Doudnabacteria bacterium]|nr:GatB/YqeY domain-containing protein [Candidatus Doudnabacteria bacterium]